MKKIILLGYMGCGKSTIAKTLSKKLQLPFVDLDDYIIEKSKMSIQTIFEELGEIQFRKMEHEALIALLALDQTIIIGLGGGTPCYANNHELLKAEHVESVYLKASIATLFERLFTNKSKRPLIAHMDQEQMKEFIATHLFERSYFYNQAKHIVSVDEKSVEQTVLDIEAVLA
ncbi:shikimate kinase [Flavobacterium crassostreae]|uniref:Shikimate kinase n=1 Tax=Flavobacterium crassostreae TaxID=1763534 RepID=A0A1B9DMJ1_9FLAO|nr:shikimate kinase [Flavobacterium crassostreae]OCB70911.1 shikimate kinase [Flavobacterium crassostreae]